MPNDAKAQQVAAIMEDIQAAGAMWVIDYRGLTVKQVQQLRHSLTEVGATMTVYKNRLAKIALANLELPTIDDVLEGPSAFVFAGEDVVASAKALKTFAKENANAIAIKGGVMDAQAMNAEQVQAFADLPSREELIAKLLGCLQNPMSGLVRVLNGPAEQFVRTLAAVADSKNAA